MKAPIERLMEKVVIRVPDECWGWKAAKYSAGYGVFVLDGKQTHASRAAYRLLVGPVKDDEVVCHSCDNPECCKPTHLFLGTQKDNIQDMHRKGRDYNGHDKITHCPSGHEYTPENTRIHRRKRICRACDRARNHTPDRREATKLRMRARRAALRAGM